MFCMRVNDSRNGLVSRKYEQQVGQHLYATLKVFHGNALVVAMHTGSFPGHEQEGCKPIAENIEIPEKVAVSKARGD